MWQRCGESTTATRPPGCRPSPAGPRHERGSAPGVASCPEDPRRCPCASWSCSAPPARCRPATATTTATCCAGTTRGSCSTRARAPSARCSWPASPPPTLTRICVTHFHGDHCLGLPGMHPADLARPGAAPGRRALPGRRRGVLRPAAARLAASTTTAELRAVPGRGGRARTRPWARHARGAPRCEHPIETYGYRLVEPDGRRMLPERLAAHGVAGPAVGELQRDGPPRPSAAPRAPRRGQRAPAGAAVRLRDGHRPLRRRRTRSPSGADLLVIESTFLDGGRRRWPPRSAT